MKKLIKKFVNYITKTPFSCVFKFLYNLISLSLYCALTVKWRISGNKLPSEREVEEVVNKVTFIYKSFNRKPMAKRLYRNIMRYYPGARVIIADDSKKPLKLKGEGLTVINLEFNSGISYGLNRALERVETPFTMRMDDDMLLTPFTKIHNQLSFLEAHKEIDLSSVQLCNAPFLPNPNQEALKYANFPMDNAPKKLIVPHNTKIDESHYVFGKTSNCFLARTEKYKAVGYDDNIRMIDHHEFFFRAAGELVAATDITAYVFHYRNRFDRGYNLFRTDILADSVYITKKHPNF